MGPEHVVAAVMLAGLVLYVLGGGADFGGGVWDLLASGPRKKAQRAAIERAIGPVWEANHVWFVFVFVLLFAAFPPAFARVTTARFRTSTSTKPTPRSAIVIRVAETAAWTSGFSRKSPMRWAIPKTGAKFCGF